MRTEEEVNKIEGDMSVKQKKADELYVIEKRRKSHRVSAADREEPSFVTFGTRVRDRGESERMGKRG
jgi:hypothetical protein